MDDRRMSRNGTDMSSRGERSLLGRVLTDTSGATLVFAALGLVALLGMVALAVDIGMMMTARTESQRAADAGALAGAGELFLAPDNPEGARQEAIRFANMHDVRGLAPDVQPEDVDVLLNEQKVRVRVHHTDDRGSAIRTFFARVLGFDRADVDVSTVAAARAYPSIDLECILPLALPDRWCEEGWNGADGSCSSWPEFDPSDTFESGDDTYEPWNPEAPDDPYTGYSENDAGYRILIKPGDPSNSPQPGWYYPFRIPGTQGGADYREAIRECRGDQVEWGEEMEVTTEPGNMIGPTKQGFSDLIAEDPDAVWNESMNCVTSSGSSDCRWSPRIRPMVMFSPESPPASGAKPFTVSNFVGIFVEEINGNDIWVRFVKYMGVNPSEVDGDIVPGPLVQQIRLVE